MRRSYVLASLLGALVVAAGGCASSPGSFARATTQTSPLRASSSTHLSLAALRDSLRAQEIADREGPGVSVHVELSSFASSRRVRTSFRLEDDAYVVVGHLGPDGVVRIIFPNDPSDNGLVQGGKTYRLPEFSAGYFDMYRWRSASYGMFRSQSSRYDSYDGAGYVFVIAAWRPMRFERFSENGEWSSFEIADEMYLRDPRPAIYELATLLTGENREAYTVKFANYFSAVNSYGSYGSSAFASTFCLGYEPLGYSGFGYSDPWGYSVFTPNRYAYGTYSGYFTYGSSRYAYRYDAAQGCYRTYLAPIVRYADGGVPAFAPKPFTPRDTNTASGDSSGNRRTLPITVVRPRLRDNPTQPKNVAPGETASSPEYRRRGLIATDDAGSDRAARHDSGRLPGSGASAGAYARPAIQEMMNRRREMADPNPADGGYRPSPRNVNGRQGGTDYNRPTRNDGPRREPGTESRTQPQADNTSRPAPDLPSIRPQAPRTEPVRTEVRPADPPRPPETPRVESRPPESSPVSRPPEPAPASRPPVERQP